MVAAAKRHSFSCCRLLTLFDRRNMALFIECAAISAISYVPLACMLAPSFGMTSLRIIAGYTNHAYRRCSRSLAHVASHFDVDMT